MSTSTTKPLPKHLARMVERHAALRETFREAFAEVETYEPPEGTTKKDAAQRRKDLAFMRDEAGEKLHAVAERLRANGFVLADDDADPVRPAPSEPDPVPLAKIKKDDVLHIWRKAAKGYWTCDGCSVSSDGKTLNLKVRWHKEPTSIALKDVARAAVKRGRVFVPVVISARGA